MKDTTGLLVPDDLMKSAASSSAVPPISPIMMMPSVCARARARVVEWARSPHARPRRRAGLGRACGSLTKRSRQSTKLVPLKGSPPMPTTVDWPRPSIVVWYTASYVSVPDRDTMPTLPGLWMYPCAVARGASAVAARRGAQTEPQRRGRPRCGLRAAPGPHRHDPNFALAGLDDARAIGANEPCLALLAEDLLHADLRAAAAQRVAREAPAEHRAGVAGSSGAPCRAGECPR